MRTAELFSVVQFFPDGGYEVNASGLDAEAAVNRAKALTQTVGARIGTTREVIITDRDDMTVFQWKFGAGVVFPPRAA